MRGGCSSPPPAHRFKPAISPNFDPIIAPVTARRALPQQVFAGSWRTLQQVFVCEEPKFALPPGLRRQRPCSQWIPGHTALASRPAKPRSRCLAPSSLLNQATMFVGDRVLPRSIVVVLHRSPSADVSARASPEPCEVRNHQPRRCPGAIRSQRRASVDAPSSPGAIRADEACRIGRGRLRASSRGRNWPAEPTAGSVLLLPRGRVSSASSASSSPRLRCSRIPCLLSSRVGPRQSARRLRRSTRSHTAASRSPPAHFQRSRCVPIHRWNCWRQALLDQLVGERAADAAVIGEDVREERPFTASPMSAGALGRSSPASTTAPTYRYQPFSAVSLPSPSLRCSATASGQIRPLPLGCSLQPAAGASPAVPAAARVWISPVRAGCRSRCRRGAGSASCGQGLAGVQFDQRSTCPSSGWAAGSLHAGLRQVTRARWRAMPRCCEGDPAPGRLAPVLRAERGCFATVSAWISRSSPADFAARGAVHRPGDRARIHSAC